MLDDDGKLYQRFANKRVNAKKEGIRFFLTFGQYKELMTKAAVVSSDLGVTGYHLARYNDAGNYTKTNCRFVPCSVNYAERKTSDKMLAASKRNVRLALAALTDPNVVARRNVLLEAYQGRRKKAARERREKYEIAAHQSYLGARNSQFGTFWITDENVNKKWAEHKGTIPNGFRRGRVQGVA